MLNCDGAIDYVINEVIGGVMDGLNNAANDCVFRLGKKVVV